MARAAVPDYLGRDFTTASVGMRFNAFFSGWEDDWSKSKQPGWSGIKAINEHDRKTMHALLQRQSSLAAALPDCFTFPATSIAPFTTGMGNEHPLENGFAFLWPYGLPYLPGSGIKGVLRQAARELMSGEWGNDSPWHQLPSPTGRGAGGEGPEERALNMLFGLESADRQTDHFRGVLSCWDVIPDIPGKQLMVDIMTPHQSHYYQEGKQPHDSGQPTPISFLTVPPGSAFTFHVPCDTTRLARLAPELAQDDHWQTLLEAAFEHAFDWLGFGAKTAVGYGAMAINESKRDQQKEAEQRKQDQQQEEAEQRKQEAEREKRLQERTANLPEDAACLVRKLEQLDQVTTDQTTAFVDAVTTFLEHYPQPGAEAMDMLYKQMERHKKGIMKDPEAVQGKKKKPKYKGKIKDLAVRLRDIKNAN